MKSRKVISTRAASWPDNLGALVALVAFGPLGCGGLGARQDAAPSHEDAALSPEDGKIPDNDGSPLGQESGSAPTGGDEALLGAPLPFAPTADGFGLNAVLAKGYPFVLSAHVRASGAAAWGESVPATVTGVDIAEWRFDGLSPATRYEYEVIGPGTEGTRTLYAGSAVTQKQAGQPFTFALISDSHIGADLKYTNQGDPTVLQAVSAELGKSSPDFMINLGDILDFHMYGFNDAPPNGEATRAAYLNYRRLLGDTLGKTTHFLTIGNWDGENGTHSAEEIAWSREQRMLYVPGPSPTSYPESGSPYEDYYAFTWGDALCVVLNVMTYTPTEHLLGNNPGVPDDWTLGTAQITWLANTLANAKSKWRFLFIHHPVGGKAGDDLNSAYGRGGGQAANVGEQATVHQLMRQYGAQIFFYGHDHVFTDMVVDGIHYSEPSNAGAIWMFSDSTTGYTQSWREPGFAKVAVAPDKVNVQFINKSGSLLYEYSLP